MPRRKSTKSIGTKLAKKRGRVPLWQIQPLWQGTDKWPPCVVQRRVEKNDRKV